ncbi:MAG TPA: FG-GAP-like repeat-containing protein [Verrucomicrobiae bacterium]|nr:FG-GAP-like repeat-containing protein [Verrucomicrobiae bacterium]
MAGLLTLAVVVVLLREYNWLGAADRDDRLVSAAAAQVGRTRVLIRLPEFVLENAQGDSSGLLDLRGTVWIADFIFTRCAGTCPMITARMAGLAAACASDPALKDVRFVSISVDPEYDRPEVLRDYAERVHADPARWSFLTGTRAAVRGLVRDGFKLPVEDQDDKAMPIMHSQSFVLVDRQGGVRSLVDPLGDHGLDDVTKALQAIAAEPKVADLHFPEDAGDPHWYEARRNEQQAAANGLRAPHAFRFTDRLGAAGIPFLNKASEDITRYFRPTHYDHGTAVAAADVDGDGRTDLYFVNQAGPNGLYRNLGDGRFEDITATAGVAVGDRACVGASFADIDGDGDPDLYVTAVRAGNLLFRNDGGGRFTDITTSAGVGGHGEHASGAVFFDADGDGDLDLFVTSVGRYTGEERRADGLWVSFPDSFAGHLHPDRGEASLFFRNLGEGRFEDGAQDSGLKHAAWSGDAIPFDDDADGRTDLYVLSMQGHDELWRNLGGGRFERRGRQVFPATPWGSMGAAVLDWNGDGRLDLFVTDMHTDMAGELRPEDERRKHDWAAMFPPRFLGTDGNHVLGNALFTAEGGDRFTEQSDAANAETGWPWGPSAADLNADGWTDLFVAAGMNFPHRYHGNDVLLNEQGRRFVNAEFLLGVEPRESRVRPWFTLDCDGADAGHPICRGESVAAMSLDGQATAVAPGRAALHGPVTVWAARASRSSVVFDLDGDGDLDVVTNDYGDVPQVLVSDLAQRGPVRFVTVRLQGRGANRDGLGAVVALRASGRTQRQALNGKSGYLSQSSLPLYFGLGEAASAESVTVTWPGGQTQTVRGPIRSGTHLVIRQP